MAQEDWHQVGVPKALTAKIQELMDAGIIVGFTRPAQFYSHAAQMEIRRVLEDARLTRELLAEETPPAVNSSEAGQDGSDTALSNEHSA